MGRKLVIGVRTAVLGVLACAWVAPTSAWAKEDPRSFDTGAKVAAQPPSEAEMMYEAMKRSGRGSKNDAAIDRAIERAQKDSEKNRKALRMELAARAWKDPFVDDSPGSGNNQRGSGGGDDEIGAARADAARARKETARARADAAVARREASRAKSDAARVEAEAIAQADAALARAEAARVEAAAARTDALAARASCAALPGPGQRSPAHKMFVSHSAPAKRFPSMGRARLASATVSRPAQPVEAPPPPALPPAVEDLPKPALATTSGTPTGPAPTGFIVVPIPPPPPTQGRASSRRP